MKKSDDDQSQQRQPSNSIPRPPGRALVVQKYGGSSLARPEQIQAVARNVAELYKKGLDLVIVVSAMGKTTDQLVELAYKVSPTPNRRELDMLLTTGERISMALMSMAINDQGCRAVSFTGSQAGVFTDDSHSNARIIDMKPLRIAAELERKHIAILAGFQGVSPQTKEITTLGRGGSDTTAVAMAAYFRAERCEIRKDVDGVYSADPNAVANARPLPHLDYDSLLDMTFWGAKVLHYRSVELAALLKIQLFIGLAHGEGPHTLIDGESPVYEQARILSVNSHKEVRKLKVNETSLGLAFSTFASMLKASHLPLPQFLDSEVSDACTFLITAPLETLDAIAQASKGEAKLHLESHALSTVTATCQGAFASIVPIEITQVLSEHKITLHKMLFGAMGVTVVVDQNERDRAISLIHAIELQP